MKKNYVFFLTICFFSFSNLIIGQTKNANDFLKFAKQDFSSKSSQLESNNWEILHPVSTETNNGIKIKKGFYGKAISNKEYYIILEFLTSNQTTTRIQTTSIKLPNGIEFDKWVSELENMGYKLQKVAGQNGQLFGGEKGIMIKAGIKNIEYPETQWSYEISIIIDNK